MAEEGPVLTSDCIFEVGRCGAQGPACAQVSPDKLVWTKCMRVEKQVATELAASQVVPRCYSENRSMSMAAA